MIRDSDAFIFFLSVFIAITFTSAGLYLSDELSPANQLSQLYHSDQLTYHSAHYGIYENGSVNYAISGANYIMPYSMELPALSFYAEVILDHFPDASRLVPLIFWILFIMFIMSWKVKNKIILYTVGVSLVTLNIIFYNPFIVDNIEILSIVLTNILVYGLFGTMVLKILDVVTDEKVSLTLMWIIVMSCSSLLFWVGTLKDHVLVATLFIIILYSIIQLNKTNNTKYLIYLSLSDALIIWTRPELSIVVIPISIIFLIYKYREYVVKPLLEFIIYTGIFSIPIFINNYVVTGSIFKFPFQAVENKMGGIHFSSDMYGVLVNEIPTYIIKNLSGITFDNILGLLFFPLNGGVGLVPFLLVSIVGIVLYLFGYKTIKLTFEEKLLYISSFNVVLMYLFTSYLGFGMHTEQGMLPDMRYFSLIYAPLTIASLSVLTRTYDLDYKNMIKNYVIYIGIFLISFSIAIGISFPINGFMGIFGFGVIVIVSMVIIDVIRNKNVKSLGELIVILSAAPAVWQIFITVTTNKMYIYPMFIPVIDFIKNLIFI